MAYFTNKPVKSDLLVSRISQPGPPGRSGGSAFLLSQAHPSTPRTVFCLPGGGGLCRVRSAPDTFQPPSRDKAVTVNRGTVHIGRSGTLRSGTVQFSIQEKIHRRNVKRFRRGLVFKALRLLYHSTLGSRTMKKKNKHDGYGRGE